MPSFDEVAILFATATDLSISMFSKDIDFPGYSV